MRISDWSSDVCSSDLLLAVILGGIAFATTLVAVPRQRELELPVPRLHPASFSPRKLKHALTAWFPRQYGGTARQAPLTIGFYMPNSDEGFLRSEEHTSELQSLMRISYAVFCLKKKKKKCHEHHNITTQDKLYRNHTTE